MFTIDYLIKENARLRAENNDLKDVNQALAHILQYTMSSLGSIRIPRRFEKARGKIVFAPVSADYVDIQFVYPETYTSQTGDPILDSIFQK